MFGTKEKEFDYYETLSPDVLARTKVFTEKIANLTKIIVVARRNLNREIETVSKLEDRIENLRGLSTVTLTDDTVSLDKYKVSLRKLTTELSISQDVVSSLRDVAIPAKERELKKVEQNIVTLLKVGMRDSRTIAEKRIRIALAKAEKEREDYINCWRKIYEACGQTLFVNDESLLPGSWLAREVLEVTPLPGDKETPEPVETEPETISPQNDLPEEPEPTENEPQMTKGSIPLPAGAIEVQEDE